MRQHAAAPGSADSFTPPVRAMEWRALGHLWPYLLEYRGRAALALSFLILAKLANVAVPLALKAIIDRLTTHAAFASSPLAHGVVGFPPALAAHGATAFPPALALAPGMAQSGGGGPSLFALPLLVPIALIVGYGVLRFGATLFNELRDAVFAKVTQRAIRRIALEVFQHLHRLDLRFHLERQTGGVTRDIERGTRGIETLMRFTLFSIAPTLVEMALVTVVLAWKYDAWYALITLGTLVVYIALTVWITEWRTAFRRRMNELDSRAHTRAIDSLINYETVKYFGNEGWEARRYDENLASWEQAAVKSQTSLAALNAAQSLVIGVGSVALMLRAATGVAQGVLSLGDLVMINALLLQLYVPLNFLGVIYREIKQALTDMQRMFQLLGVHTAVADLPGAAALVMGPGELRFEGVDFAYDPRRQILHQVDFVLPAGQKLAVVGTSGAGKSTLSRLLFRFYDVGVGVIRIDGQDLRSVTQRSLRAAIGIVPQDTVLFNDTIYYNIAYGNPAAERAAVLAAARAAHIHDFIEALPDGYDTVVGERGLKLSGGEKQRVAIARTLLKNPRILVFDEATSALDSRSERMIQEQLDAIALSHTTLVIAHRLSTVVDADQILVLEQGRVVERGTHPVLLAQGGLYAQMWALQQRQQAE